MWGAIATGLFAASFATDASVSWGQQVWRQLASVGFTALFACGLTFLILLVLRALFGSLRVSEEDESVGLDLVLHSEAAYIDVTGPLAGHTPRADEEYAAS